MDRMTQACAELLTAKCPPGRTRPPVCFSRNSASQRDWPLSPHEQLPVGRMERKMNKTMTIVASAIVAMAAVWVPAAQARGGHHFGGGFSAFKFSSALSRQRHHHFRV